MRFKKEKHLYGVNMLYFLLFGNCVFGNEILFEICNFNCVLFDNIGNLQKVFVQIKKGIITKLWYRKFQNRTFELRHYLSCRFQVVVLLLLLREECGKGFSETS